MKSESGVTILSLIIYVGILFAVVLMVGRITGFIHNNYKNIEDSSIESEYSKFNLYILKQCKDENCSIDSLGVMSRDDENDRYHYTTSVDNTEKNAIKFYKKTDNEEYNIIGQVGDGIYYNKVKICSNIDEFKVSELPGENGKNKIKVELQFKGNKKKFSNEYNMRSQIIN